MALTSTAQTTVILNGRTITVAAALTIDLPTMPSVDFTHCLRSINLDDQNNTDLPESARQVAGFNTSGGSVLLAGTVTRATYDDHGELVTPALTVADLFNPDNDQSPMYHLTALGAGVTLDLGVGGEPLVHRFTGLVVPGGSQLDHDQGEVTLGLGDLTGRWTTVPGTATPITVPPYNAGLTSEYVMDSIIRSQEGASSWPAQRSSCVLSVGFRSSLWPEVGRLDSTTPFVVAGPPTFTPGAMGSAVAPDNPFVSPQLFYTTSTPVTGNSNVFVEAWASGSTEIAVSDSFGGFDQASLAVDYEPGSQMVASITTPAGEDEYVMPLPADDGRPHYIAGKITWAGGIWTAQLFYDATTASSTGRSAPSARPSVGLSRVTVRLGNTLEALQVSSEYAPTSNAGFVPIAVLDPSLNPLTVPPPIEAGTLALDELQTIAAAEYGYLRRDEAGVIRFSNRKTLAAQMSTRDITSRVSLKKGLTTTLAGADPYNHIQVPYTEWTFGKPAAVFVLQSVKKIPPGKTVWTQPLDQVGADLDLDVTYLPDRADPLDGGSYYRASLDQYGNGRHPGVTFTITPMSSASVQITAVNPYKSVAWLITDTGKTDLAAGAAGTGLWIGGTPATPSDEQLADIPFGKADRSLTVDSNPYRQDADAAADVGSYLLGQLAVSLRDFESIPIVFDHLVQTGDVQHLIDPDRSKVDEYVRVWGRSLSIEFPPAGQDGGSLDMTLSARACAAPGAVLLGFPGRAVLGSAATGPGTFYLPTGETQ